jgi:MFS family permease
VPLALTTDRFTNGLTRPLFGFVSDRIGRENTMFLAVALEGIAMTARLRAMNRCCSCCCAALCSSAEARFLAVSVDASRCVRDTERHPELWVSVHRARHRVDLRRPDDMVLHDATGGWTSVLGAAIGADFLAAALAIAALTPMRLAFLRR